MGKRKRKTIFWLWTKQAGITLVELIVAMGIFTIISWFIISFALDVGDSSLRISNSLLTQTQIRQTLNLMVSEIRSAGQSNVGGYLIAQSASSTFTFYTDINRDGILLERVRYFLDGNTFSKGIITPTGSPLEYVDSSEEIIPLVDNVVLGLDIFSYYGSSATSSDSSPLGYPIDVLDIRIVGVNLSANQGTVNVPSVVGEKEWVTIRNLRYK